MATDNTAAWREALERIADPRNTHFAGDAQVVAREALASPPAQPAVPEGWKLVPIKPTMQMINALADTDPEHESVWDAVLAAAPEKGQP
jgi:hypothetical protein